MDTELKLPDISRKNQLCLSPNNTAKCMDFFKTSRVASCSYVQMKKGNLMGT